MPTMLQTAGSPSSDALGLTAAALTVSSCSASPARRTWSSLTCMMTRPGSFSNSSNTEARL